MISFTFIYFCNKHILQISDWEEEILSLKKELKQKETAHKEEILKMKAYFDVKLGEKDTENQVYKIKLADLQMSINQSQTESQTDSEKLWEKATSYKDIINQTSNSQPKGPQSLPTELVSEAHREVRRLQELRRYIQEECDHLILRKERLKEEVVWHAGSSYSYHGPLPCDRSTVNNYSHLEKTDVWHCESRKLDQKVVCMQNHTSSL